MSRLTVQPHQADADQRTGSAPPAAHGFATAAALAKQGQTAPNSALTDALDKAASWTRGMRHIQASLAETVAHPERNIVGNAADMHAADILVSRTGIHLTKLENLDAQLRSPGFQQLSKAEQNGLLVAINHEMSQARDLCSQASDQAFSANRAMSDGDARAAQVGMTVTKGVMAAAPFIEGAIVEKMTGGNKLAGTAARDLTVVTERLAAAGVNDAIGGSQDVIDTELGTTKSVVAVAAVDALTAGMLDKAHLKDGLHTHLGNLGASTAMGGAKSAADAPSPWQNPAKFAGAVGMGMLTGAVGGGAKLPGGLKKIKDTALEQPANVAAGAAAGAVNNLVQGHDPVDGFVAGAAGASTKSGSKLAGLRLHAVVAKEK